MQLQIGGTCPKPLLSYATFSLLKPTLCKSICAQEFNSFKFRSELSEPTKVQNLQSKSCWQKKVKKLHGIPGLRKLGKQNSRDNYRELKGPLLSVFMMFSIFKTIQRLGYFNSHHMRNRSKLFSTSSLCSLVFILMYFHGEQSY